MTRILLSVLSVAALLVASPVLAAGDAVPNKQIKWSFDGPFGKLDKTQAQRGFQVYKEVCSACHSLGQVSYRSLEALGFEAGEVKTIASEKQVKDSPGDDGEMFERPGKASDRFVSPFANEQAARAANGGAYPPDLSLITKARPDGANYVYSILTGYEQAKFYRCTESLPQGGCKAFAEVDDAALKADKERIAGLQEARKKREAEYAKPNSKGPQPLTDAAGNPLPQGSTPPMTSEEEAAMKPQVLHCMHVHKEEIAEIVDGKETGRKLEAEVCNELAEGKYFNPHFPGGQISMAPPLADDRVSYMDETKATLDQEARDVVAFLHWAAEPEMEQRKTMGIKAIFFLIIASIFLYVAKRRVWRNIH